MAGLQRLELKRLAEYTVISRQKLELACLPKRAVLSRLFSRLLNVKHLDIADRVKRWADVLLPVNPPFDLLPNTLTRLHFGYIRFGPGRLFSMLKHCVNLTSLAFDQDCDDAEPDSDCRFPRLAKLDIHEFGSVEQLAIIFRCCPNVTDLCLNSEFVDLADTVPTLQRLNSLTALDVHAWHDGRDCNVGHMTGLRVLDVRRCPVTDTGPSPLPESLEELKTSSLLMENPLPRLRALYFELDQDLGYGYEGPEDDDPGEGLRHSVASNCPNLQSLFVNAKIHDVESLTNILASSFAVLTSVDVRSSFGIDQQTAHVAFGSLQRARPELKISVTIGDFKFPPA